MYICYASNFNSVAQLEAYWPLVSESMLTDEYMLHFIACIYKIIPIFSYIGQLFKLSFLTKNFPTQACNSLSFLLRHVLMALILHTSAFC